MSEPEYSPQYSLAEAAADCQGSLHPLALRGIQFFNEGEYFEAHEMLELAWREETSPIRDVYRGILQVGVGYYHIQRGNYRGARKMFLRCRQWLSPFPAVCRGIDLAALTADFEVVELELIRLGEAGIHNFNQKLFRPVKLYPVD